MGREGDGRDVMGEENTLRYATLSVGTWLL